METPRLQGVLLRLTLPTVDLARKLDAMERALTRMGIRLLEEELVPLYYERDRSGLPRGWLRVVKEAIRSVAPRFSARRMVKEYTDTLYAPAGAACRAPNLVK